MRRGLGFGASGPVEGALRKVLCGVLRKKEANIKFSLLRVILKFVLGVYSKDYQTWILLWYEEMNHGLVSEKLEKSFVKYPSPLVGTR